MKLIHVIRLVKSSLVALLVCLPAVRGVAGESISISGAWALYPLVVRWGEEYKKLHPDLVLDISAGGAGKGLTDAVKGAVDLGMVSREITPEEKAKGAWPIPVAKDAVIGIINVKNPAAPFLKEHGVKRAQLAAACITQSVKTWGELTGQGIKTPIRLYTRSDACGAGAVWAEYLGGHQEDLKGTGVYGDPAVGEAVARDPMGLGFNNVNFAYDQSTGAPLPDLIPLPLDLNDNGILEPAERFYETRESLMKAIADGRYPSPPSRELYLITKGAPQKETLKAFLLWAVTDGQRFAPEAGYVPLSDAQRQEAFKALGIKPPAPLAK